MTARDGEGSAPSDPYLADAAVDFDGLVASEYGRVLAVALALCGNPATAQDITQEAFLVVLRKLGGGGIDNPAAYVRGVAANMARSVVRRRLAELRALARVGSQVAPASPVGGMPEDSEQFWAAVRSLPARQAVVAALFYADDLSVAEIAACLGMAEGTVKAHLSRARSALATRLGVSDEGNR